MTTVQEYLNEDLSTKHIYIDYDDDYLLPVNNLDLSNFKQVERIEINWFGSPPLFKTINLKNCKNLRELILVGCDLANLDFLGDIPSPEKLTYLAVGCSSSADLTVLERFINLKELSVRDVKSWTDKGDFLGNAPLKKLTKLLKFNNKPKENDLFL